MKYSCSFVFFAISMFACTVEIPVESDIDHIDIDIPANYLVPPAPISNPEGDDEYFFNYRLDQFAPDTEPLIEETFGSALMFDDIGFWEHVAYTSVAVGFTTNLPAISAIEYGPTEAYGQVTKQSESYYYQHLHYIKNLSPDSSYHYRLIAKDYKGTLIASADHTFT
ncbi:MAG: hypothetical protein LBQ73_07830, partial [Tannerellaceae bacterium]|nr:hypothetical protein [Tannerellaceae bacterium]